MGATSPAICRTHLEDDFRAGLSPDRWRLRPVDDLPEGDGLVDGSPDGLVVVPTTTHDDTGEPAFRTPPDGVESPSFLRWATFSQQTSSSGAPGFDAVAGEVLTCSVELAVRRYEPPSDATGADDPHHHADLRRGAAALITIDMESGMVFDFAFTNTAVLALYERLPRPSHDGATFSYVVPVAARTPEQFHRCEVSYDRAAGRARWVLDGAEVLAVDRIGRKVLDDSLILWQGPGDEELVAPRQLDVGLCTLGNVWGQGIRLAVRRLGLTATTTTLANDMEPIR
jgi:hypothetical protein